MKLSDYNYDLPASSIALHPPKERGSSRLLVLNRKTGDITDDLYQNILDYLTSDDLLVINNTRVLPARLLATTELGAERELLLLEKHGKANDHHSSLVMYRRKIRIGQKLTVGGVSIVVEEVFNDGTARISSTADLWSLAEQKGTVPLPPYMHREEEKDDRERYQTVFAKEKGSVAAPTASLNLTEALLDAVCAKGAKVAEITLHVGLGTFMPIRVDDVTQHKMHQEYFEISAATAAAVRATKEKGGRIFAVGTTVTRTLEYAADDIMRGKESIAGEADIFIYPGYEFKLVDALVTNFHVPQSTVLMMAAAFAGWDNLRTSYQHAIDKGYAFLSYGDSMLVL